MPQNVALENPTEGMQTDITYELYTLWWYTNVTIEELQLEDVFPMKHVRTSLFYVLLRGEDSSKNLIKSQVIRNTCSMQQCAL